MRRMEKFDDLRLVEIFMVHERSPGEYALRLVDIDHHQVDERALQFRPLEIGVFSRSGYTLSGSDQMHARSLDRKVEKFAQSNGA
jgi:hypothetical protein